MTTEPVKLNLGSADTVIPGYLAIDRKYGSEVYPLPPEVADPDRFKPNHRLTENSVDEIRASHILEHFSFADVPKVLAEWVRVLKPGGLIRVAVPDAARVFTDEFRDDHMALCYLMGGQIDADDYHRSAFTESMLRAAMEEAGLTKIEPWSDPKRIDTAMHPISLRLAGTKPAPPEAPPAPGNEIPPPEGGAARGVASPGITPKPPSGALDVKICAVTSIPRVGHNAHWGCLLNALRPFGIPVRTGWGAYWGHIMQVLLEDAQHDDLDWIITVDYDTLLTEKHLDAMFGIFGRHPEIDALAALQCRRNRKTPLMTVAPGSAPAPAPGTAPAEMKVEVDGSPIVAKTAHFGLTLIRVDSLKRVPKPWFFGLPNADGEWRDLATADELRGDADPVFTEARNILVPPDTPPHVKIDPDIWFWKQWQRAGNVLAVAPTVRIGHLEESVSFFDEDMQPHLVSIGEWRKAQT